MRVSDPSKLHLKKKELTQIWKATCVLCDPNTTSSWKKSPLNSSRFVPIPWTRWLGFRRGVPAETVDEDLAVVWVLIHHLSNLICHITVLIYSSSPYRFCIGSSSSSLAEVEVELTVWLAEFCCCCCCCYFCYCGWSWVRVCVLGE